MADAEANRAPSADFGPRHPLPIGTRLDHYVLQEVLGAGGFGITYLAVHETLGKQYAIKEYFPGAFSHREGVTVRPSHSSAETYQWGLDRFVTEARALARFKHHSIVDVTNIFEANGTAYIVLGYEAGQNMGEWLKRLGRRPTQAEMDKIVVPLLSALEEIHNHSLLHRDIAPDNILIRPDGMPVLIDFGSARELTRHHSRVQSMVVKQGFSAPEQYSTRPGLQGSWTDIYAMASTLYRAVVGQAPPEATDRLLKDEVVSLGHLAKHGYRPEFLTAIEHGLRIKTAERPQTVADWRERLMAPSVRVSAVLPSGTTALKGSPATGRTQRPQIPQSTQTAAEWAASGGSPQSEKRSRPGGHADLSWLDQVDEVKAAPQPPAMMDNPALRGAYSGIVGTVAGAAAGALFSIVLSSIFSSGCFADSCIWAYLRACTIVGAIAGMLIGAWWGKTMPVKPDGKHRPDQF
jgi:serine/threonine protein kinase